jgi:hypothetical protein
MLDTDIPSNEAKIVKEKEERSINTFNEFCPCLIQVDLDLQALQKVLQYNEQQRKNILPILP